MKICCISSHYEAQLAVDAGVSAIGLVGPMPSGPGIIDDALIAEIAVAFGEKVDTFLLTSEIDGEEIIKHAKRTGTSTIQLVDRVGKSELKKVRAALPGIHLIQVIHVLGKESISEALDIQDFVDCLLLDSGNPNADTRTLGGTGNTHNWTISKEIVAASGIPVYLAGGLRPDNVCEAIRLVRPDGVDLCSGVRTNGHLDPKKLSDFVKAVNSTNT